MPEIRVGKVIRGIKTVRCFSWNAFQKYVSKEAGKFEGHLFRGQALSTWALEPTLLRHLKAIKTKKGVISHEDWKLISNNQLKSFKEKTFGLRHAYIGSQNPDSLSDNEWFALGQHYGLMTPLLDWTESPFVALFFSFWGNHNSQQTQFRAIWDLDRGLVERVIEEHSNNISQEKKNEKFHALQFHRSDLETNRRLLQQKGLFTVSNTGQTIESWVKSVSSYIGKDKPLLTKYLIPNHCRDQILVLLDKMNINSISLFPDLSGVSTYCNYLLKEPI